MKLLGPKPTTKNETDKRPKGRPSANGYLDPTTPYASLVEQAQISESRAWGWNKLMFVLVVVAFTIAAT